LIVRDALALYVRYIAIAVRAQMSYRASFLLRGVGQLLITALEFVGFASLFARFGRVRGWTLEEMALFYGIISIALALGEGIMRGFDKFSPLVKTGELDRILLRPRSAALQVLGYDVDLRFGRLLQGLVILGWSMHRLGIVGPAPVALIGGAIVGGTCLFGGLFVLQATACFWTTESLELFNCITYGGVEVGQFPLTIYRGWFRALFTFVIPIATVNYFPAHALLGRVDPLGSTRLVQCASPLAGVLFLGACLLLWRRGIRRYTSTGS
jgi:ABC-2 type transport system permease protein